MLLSGLLLAFELKKDEEFSSKFHQLNFWLERKFINMNWHGKVVWIRRCRVDDFSKKRQTKDWTWRTMKSWVISKTVIFHTFICLSFKWLSFSFECLAYVPSWDEKITWNGADWKMIFFPVFLLIFRFVCRVGWLGLVRKLEWWTKCLKWNISCSSMMMKMEYYVFVQFKVNKFRKQNKFCTIFLCLSLKNIREHLFERNSFWISRWFVLLS